MKDSARRKIAELGTVLGPAVLDSVRELFAKEQAELAARVPIAASDLRYGPHARNLLDLYTLGGGGARPVVLFVHGGGFLMGDKGGVHDWPNAAVGRTMAEAGFLGAVMTYRLAPDHTWPAGGEDVAAAVDWLRSHAAEHGGDPERIVLLGTSAGAVHIAAYLKLRGSAAHEVRGVALLSGLYGYTPLEQRDTLYYGDAGFYPERMPRDAVATTGLPLFVACAEFDPPRFQAEFLGLMAERLERHGAIPRGTIALDHNHYSIAMHLGTSDRRLSDAIVQFARDCCQ
jgi:acetyl esterase/lipase